MSAPNRAAIIKKILRVLRKQFKPVPLDTQRSLFEHLLFACLLENSPHDAAERIFSALDKDFYDWNEVRVSTVRELSGEMRGLVDPDDSAHRLKRTLQSVFDSHYAFDVESLKKQNIGQATKQLESYDGTTPFVVAYVTQAALGGHAIAVNDGLLIALQTLGVITPAEAEKRVVPGLERAVPKSKGVETAALLHQLGVEIGKNPYGPNARKLLLDIDPGCKDLLPKRPAKTTERSEKENTSPAASSKKTTSGKTKKTPAAKSNPNKPAAGAKKSASKRPPAPTPAPSKKGSERGKANPTKKKKVPKKPTRTKKKTSNQRLSKRKPR